jgi:hypothetical protein
VSERTRPPRITRAAVYPLGGEPPEDLSATTTAQERLAMMWPLAVEAWTVAGWSIPQYSRAEMPVRVRSRGGNPRDR